MEASFTPTISSWPSLRSMLLGQVVQSPLVVPQVMAVVPKAKSRLQATYQNTYEVEQPTSAIAAFFQTILKLVFIVTMSVGFAYFGPETTSKIAHTWEGVKFEVSLKSFAASPAINFDSYAAQVNYWLTQMKASVTPVAGQSGQQTAPVSAVTKPEPIYQPPYDSTLPDGNWLSIPLIGLRSELQKTEDYDTALAQGIWQVPDFGDAGSTDLPMIVAGHRFGWDWWWKTDYWKYHSFYKLPELQPGDTVEVIADHRKWIYEIYAAEEGTEITDYSADLILYTCKYLNSPTRFFRYAKLVDPTKNTQAKASGATVTATISATPDPTNLTQK